VHHQDKEAEMSHKSIQSLICATFIILCSSCTQVSFEEKREVEIKEIAKTIDSCIGWFKDKDFDLLFSVVAHDPDYISVHPTDKVIRGFDQFAKSSEGFKNPDLKYVNRPTGKTQDGPEFLKEEMENGLLSNSTFHLPRSNVPALRVMAYWSGVEVVAAPTSE
jgi:hypothetical protein